MIRGGLQFIDSIRALINVDDVTDLVDYIRPFESKPTDYSNRKKFIVIGFLAGNADDLQRGVVNINAYAPDNSGNADITFFKSVETVLKGILKDAYSDDMEIDLSMTPKVLKDEDVSGYHFLNIRIKIFYPSITT